MQISKEVGMDVRMTGSSFASDTHIRISASVLLIVYD